MAHPFPDGPRQRRDPAPVGRWVDRGLRWSLGGLFVAAGALKLAHPQDFALVVEAFGLVPDDLARVVAVVLPLAEVLAGAGLVGHLRGSLGALAMLLAVFMAVLGYGLHLGLDVDCGCFGPLEPEGRAYAGIRPALYRDAVLGAGVLAIYAGRLWWGIRPIPVPGFVDGCGRGRRSADEA